MSSYARTSLLTAQGCGQGTNPSVNVAVVIAARGALRALSRRESTTSTDETRHDEAVGVLTVPRCQTGTHCGYAEPTNNYCPVRRDF